MFEIYCQKSTTFNIKMTGKQCIKKKIGYCLKCRKKTDRGNKKGVKLTNEIA